MRLAGGSEARLRRLYVGTRAMQELPHGRRFTTERGRYVAVVPAFPGCYSQGDSAEEALENAREAILLTIEDMRERGKPIPDPAGELVRRVAVGE